MGYSPQGPRESDTTERLNFHFHHLSKMRPSQPKVGGISIRRDRHQIRVWVGVASTPPPCVGVPRLSTCDLTHAGNWGGGAVSECGQGIRLHYPATGIPLFHDKCRRV